MAMFLVAFLPVVSAQTATVRTRSPHGTLAISCESCHTSTSWKPIRPSPDFNHNETRYPLRGMHVSVNCRQCHLKLVFTDVGGKCADCHADLHKRQFGGQCEECHTVRGWSVSLQSIKQHANRFPLLGSHAAVDCGSCHKAAAAGIFAGLNTECASCHLNEYQNNGVFDHRAANIPPKCDSCHNMDSWRGAKFDHIRFSGFALNGAHSSLDCSNCHTGTNFAGTPANCFSCHAKDFTGTTDPDHVKAGFPHECGACHNSTVWVGATFDHASRTKFTLTGAHSSQACAKCHVAGRFAGTPQDCYSCHVAVFESAKNPDHKKSNFPTDCSICHTTAGWQGARFDHSLTHFTLTGSHVSVGCKSCHTAASYAEVSATCSSCHITAYNGTRSPNHAAQSYPLDCSICHTTEQWKGAKFDHNAGTKFQLTGAHTSVACQDCHKNNVFKDLASNCVSCHLAAFNNTKNPNHASAGFPQDCTVCHTTAQWKGAKFDHNTGTKFQLTGAHVSVACQDCHKNDVFKGLASNCVSCHLTDFNNTKNPNHASAGFPQDCTVCHTTAQWKGAKFDHNTGTKFQLTGAHVSVACQDCHKNDVFKGLASNCVSCHLTDFNNTKNPNHASAGFPQDCTVCHTTAQWKGAKFDHNTGTKFQLTGAHVSVACQDCHKNDVFKGLASNCVSCHLAAFNNTKNPNHVSAGFPQDCTVCHTTAQWKGAKFDHNTGTKFQLTGAHVSVACQDCHKNNVFKGLVSNCVSCHLTDFNNTKNPNHASAGFPQDCTVCHTTAQWKGAKFDHNTGTRFQLTGAHVAAVCSDCHKNNVFKGLASNCVSCHLAKYNDTKNPNHAAAGFSQECSFCHNTSQWKGAIFDHSKTKFSLTGAHGAVDCQRCHANSQYAGLNSACISCHQTDFNRAANPNHVSAGFPQDCTVCHTTVQWKGAKFDHNTATRFTLVGAHVTVACTDCHKNNVFKGLAATCVSCHLTDFNNTKSPNHVAAGFPQDCALCHTSVQWKGAKFDHNTATKFALVGAHVTVTCADCHKNNVFKGLPSTCVSCHLTDYNNTKTPNHVAAGFPQDCALCHTPAQWKGAKFDHNTATRFTLVGAHVTVACTDCHKNNIFKGLAATCVSCHLTDYNNTKTPNHVSAGFPQDCVLCHTPVQWKGAKFDHNTATKFTLVGAHITVACADCHKNNVFKGLPSTCVSCHLTDYNNSKSPNHIAAGFPQDCALCHTPVQWKGAKFDHNTATKFTLVGAHITVACANCHKNNLFKGLPSTCVSCHLTDYNNTKTPNHVAAGFPQDCALCHTPAQWKGAKFDHNTATKFALVGAHITVACANCHKNKVFKGLPSTCVSCHLTDYNNTKTPNHVAAGFPQDCALCHTSVKWKGAKFDHNTATKFTLVGAHITVACADCHKNNVFKGLPSTCVSCHLTDYNNTKTPNHVAAGFPQDCALCHTPVQWKGAKFDHNTATKFALVGAHITVACANCHKNNVFKGLPSTCVSCHLTDYNNTKTPNHVAAGFPQDCALCHTPVQWKGAKFDHNSATKFPLTGAHITVACANCHKNNVFKGLPSTCVSCHLTNFNNTKNPAHVSAGFPQDCTLCHTTAAWAGATFDHSKTGFILAGAHVKLLCAQCHANNRFAGTPAQCSGCHLAKYNATTNPKHSAAGFPTDCSLCHTTTAWTPASFNHTTATKFPLTGAHTTVSCSNCHSSGVYAGLSTACVSCHLSRYNATTNPNHVAAGFPSNCSICHTTTAWTPASFNHTTATKFPLTGAHTTVQCVKCHIGGKYAGTPTDCWSCHQAVFNATTNPNHVAANFPHDCSLCHTTTQWPGAKFNHTWFPIYSGAHAGKWTSCADCHTNSSNYKIFACTNCHQHDKTTTDSHHRQVNNYVYNSANCYACHPQGRAG